MTVTAQVVASKPNCISLLFTHDGGGGDALSITNAQLQAAAPPGQFREFLAQDAGVAPPADWARIRLLGAAAGAVLGGLGANLTESSHCRCFVRQRTGLITAILVDASIVAQRMQLDVTTAAGVAGTFQVDVEFQHSLVR